MKEMVGGCCVCSDERGWPENPLVYCDGQKCTVAVHQACYGIVTVPTGPWYCRKCESQENCTRVRCELCPSKDGALKKTDNQGWAHVVCALYIPEVRFGNVTTMEPIILQLIPQERYGKSCYICQELGKPHRATIGACMQCNKANCKQQFHVTCAQSLGLLCEEAGNYLDNVKYCGYCQHHYSKLKKGGNVKTIPPYKPISHDTSSDSGSSPEKEIVSTTSASTIKITANLSSTTLKQKKTSSASKPTTTNSNAETNLSVSMHIISSLASSSVTGVGAGASFTSTTSDTKIASPTTVNVFKEKETKYNKNVNKNSTQGKDKDDMYFQSTSSKELKEEIKPSQNFSSTPNDATMSSTSISTISTTVLCKDPIINNLSSSAINNEFERCTINGSINILGTLPAISKEMEKISSTSLSSHDAIIDAPVSVDSSLSEINSNLETNLSSSTLSKTSKDNNLTPTLNQFVAKKRKLDTKCISLLADGVNSTFRDIIKDVSVTLTPLTDFEKEIEKSAKKQKTEFGPFSQQLLHNVEGTTQNCQVTSGSSIPSSDINVSSTLNRKSEIITSGVSSSAFTFQKSISVIDSSSMKEREERYAAAQAAIAAANGNNLTVAPNSTSSCSGNAPSLYVSVPLSTANVPGINKHTTTSPLTDHFTDLTQPSHLQSSSQVSSSSLNLTLVNDIPYINGNISTISSTSSPFRQDGKSPSSVSTSSMSSVNLTANITEISNLKNCYEKSRINQIQDKDMVPARRSRTPDSGVFGSTSFTVSNASTASSCSSPFMGAMKFSYEAQPGTNSSSLSIPTSIESCLPGGMIKDSPPSSPNSEKDFIRKRGRKSKDSLSITNINDSKDLKMHHNPELPLTSGLAMSTITTSTQNVVVTTAAHMLGNQINPNSSVAQKLSDQLNLEIQDHSAYHADAIVPQYIGVPFPGKTRPTSILGSGTTLSTASVASSPLVSVFGNVTNGNLAIPQSLEQLLERQWEQGSQFLMEQAQHFDIASLLSCLHQLQSENVRLEEHVSSLIARRDHLLAVNARLAIPLNTNNSQGQSK